MVVRVSLNEPLSKGNEFNGDIVLVVCETFTTKSIVLRLVLALTVTTNLKIVWVTVSWVRNEVYEHSLFLTFTVQKKLNVFVKVTPFLLDDIFRLFFLMTCAIVYASFCGVSLAIYNVF